MNLLLHHHTAALEDMEFHFTIGDRFRNHLRNGRLSPHRPPRSLSDHHDYTVSSPLLPRRRNCSSPSGLSPCSRTRAIEHGRNELMEMIRDLPESSFELSLKDIVVEQRKNLDEDNRNAEESSIEEKDSDILNDQAEKKRRKKTNTKKLPRVSQVSRCSSMESGVFLIKLFPAFLTTSKKTSSAKPTKIQQSKDVVNESASWNNNNNNRRSRSISNIRSLSSSFRKDSGESVPGCWPFEIRKPKIRRQKTCVF